MSFDLLRHGESLIAFTHKLLNLLDVVFCPLILLLFFQPNAGGAVVVAHMLDKISAITDELTL